MKRIERIIIYSLLLVALIAFAFKDYSISASLYREGNIFGRLVEAAGEVPLFIVSAFAFGTLTFFRPKPNLKVDRVLLVVFIVLGLGFSVYGGHHVYESIDRSFSLGLSGLLKYGAQGLIGLTMFAIGFLCARLIRPEQKDEAFLFGIATLFLIGVTLGAGLLLKFIWLRPRYRTLAALSEVGAISGIESFWMPFYSPQFFTSFEKYQAGGAYGFTAEQLAEAMEKLGISEWTRDEFYAFPSGHVLSFLPLAMLCLLPRLFPKLDKKYTAIGIRLAVYALALLVGFARIVAGAHHITDVIFSLLLGFAFFDLGSTFFYERFLRQRFLPRPVEEEEN